MNNHEIFDGQKLLDRLEEIRTVYKEYLSDEDQRALKYAIFYLKLHLMSNILHNKIVEQHRSDFVEYARDNVGKKIYVIFSFYDLYMSSNPLSQEIIDDCKKEFKDGIFIISDPTSLQSVENEDLLLSTNHNFLSSFYEIKE